MMLRWKVALTNVLIALVLVAGVGAQAANILTFTEQFDHANWAFNAAVTADSTSPPAFAGGLAGDADTATDDDTGVQDQLRQLVAKGADDGSNWIFSIFILKDSDETRFPDIRLEFLTGGTTLVRGVRVNTATGASAASSAGLPADHAVVDFDALWWRLWMREPDNNTGNTNLRMSIFPAIASTIGGGNSSLVTGSIIIWGANATKADTVQTYDPDPFYSFGSSDAPKRLLLLGVGGPQ